MIRETAALTDKPFNVNVFCHQPAVHDSARETQWLIFLAPFFAQFGAAAPTTLREIYTSFVEDPDMLLMLLEEQPAVVSFHFGLPPQPAIDALNAAATAQANMEFSVQWAGQGAPLAREMPAAALVNMLAAQMND